MTCRNPFAFRAGPVTFWTTVIYLAVIIPLIYVHEVVPPAPAQAALQDGLNLTEAWQDLQTITEFYHPFNSHQNDAVRKYIIDRSRSILERNNVDFATYKTGPMQRDNRAPSNGDVVDNTQSRSTKSNGFTLFDDQTSNVTYAYASGTQYGTSISVDHSWLAQYFEANNFYIYIRGTDDPEGQWWSDPDEARKGAGVLVNCHFDSVATGFGATDDGVACVTMLQMLSYFAVPGHQPKNGVILLFNNAEEDGLLGARAFIYSPLIKFIHTFVNLEGAGAGGRAILFRASDLQAAKAYSGSPHPFGSVVAANAFERGVIHSGTDYQVFLDDFGQRGIDVAFYAPRARYHTEEDDARHTSTRSIWHMLSAALASTEQFSKTGGTTFTGERSDGRRDLVQNGKLTRGVWFDWFGKAWAAFPLRGLFAWSLTLLVTTPLVLSVVTYMLIRQDKYYFFATDIKTHLEIGDDPVPIGGWKGFSRFPLALVFAVALTIVSCLLVVKFNPLIVYSSAYAVWAMSLSIFYFSFWLIVRGASFVRPSALHRGFANVWLFILTWIIQVFAAVAEDRMQIGALYFAAFLHSAVFLAVLISLLEQFALPGKHDFAQQFHDARHSDTSGQNASSNSEPGNQADEEEEEETPTETTPLRAGERENATEHTTFANRYRRSIGSTTNADSTPTARNYRPYGHEQSWSGRLPSWTWLLQLLLLVPVHVILLGNQGLLQMSATSMTGSDGNSLTFPLLGISIVSILLLLPLSPFMHRITHHIPMFLLLVFAGTFVYSLVAFPFSVNHRFKFNFQQVIDLDESTNQVTLSGLEQFLRPVMSSLPTAAGQSVNCTKTPGRALKDCRYDASALPPHLAGGEDFETLITVKTSLSGADSATMLIDAADTRTCYVDFSRPIHGFSVEGGGKLETRYGPFPKDGLNTVQIWRRTWEGPWNLTLGLTRDGQSSAVAYKPTHVDEHNGDLSPELKRKTEPLDATVRCAWSDANKDSTIPAFTELLKYIPKWATVTKRSVGLVEVKKTYKVVP